LFHIISTLNKLFAVFYWFVYSVLRCKQGGCPTPSKTGGGNVRGGKRPGLKRPGTEMSVSRGVTG